MQEQESTIRFSTYLPVNHPLLAGGYEVDENRILKDCLVIPNDDVWNQYTEHASEMHLAPSYYLQFFPAARLDGEFELTELYQVQSDNENRVLIVGKGERKFVTHDRYVTYVKGAGLAAVSPWGARGAFSGTGCGGCFSGCLSLLGLAVVASLIMCLVFGNCFYLNQWCPCFYPETQEEQVVEEIFGYFECKTPDPSRLHVIGVDRNHEPTVLFRLRPEDEVVSNHHVFKVPLDDASKMRSYYLVLDSVTTECNSIRPTSIQVCQMFDTDTCALFEIDRARLDSCSQNKVGFQTWKDIQMCLALGTAKEIRFE